MKTNANSKIPIDSSSSPGKISPSIVFSPNSPGPQYTNKWTVNT